VWRLWRQIWAGLVRSGVSAASATVIAGVAIGVMSPASSAATVVPIRVSQTTISRPIKPGFVGVALEYNEVPQLADARRGWVNPVFVQLLRDLDPGGQGIMRIGGQSTDRTWWPVPGMSRPRGITYDLSPAWAADARLLARATGTRLMLGIELEANSQRISRVEARELVRTVGRRYIASLELGNEPELYRSIPWYRVLNGRSTVWSSRTGLPVFNRPPDYGPSELAAEISSLVPVLPSLPVAGPSSGSLPWLKSLAPLVSSSSRLKIVTGHAYALVACEQDPTSPYFPSVPHLLLPTASLHLAQDLAPAIAEAHDAGARFMVDEMGSVACNGQEGVSDSFASALWLMDTLFDFAADDVDAVNLHTYPGLPNNLFDFGRTDGHWTGHVHPLYYGALMFTRAAPPGSRLLAVRAGDRAQVRAWATVGSDRRVRVLLLNDDTARRVRIRLTVPRPAGTAQVERLKAPSAYSTGGVSLGGESFGRSTATGVLPASRSESVSARDAAYTVSLPAASAVLLTLPAPDHHSVFARLRLPVILSAALIVLVAVGVRRPRWFRTGRRSARASR
jgi:hypothetical protein